MQQGMFCATAHCRAAAVLVDEFDVKPYRAPCNSGFAR